MRPTFNLADQPWIPVVLGGARGPHDVSAREALTRAHEIRELVDPSPLVTAALHRLLLAILHRTFGPETFEAWKALWQRGRWDADQLNAYFDAWRHRFDLFDPDRPFYQVASLEAETHPPALLAQERAAGNNPTLFDHSFKARADPMPAAQAARYLVARQAFSVGGGVSKPFNLSHAPLATGLTVLALGANLFETLALNLMVYGEHGALGRTAEDRPAWEQDDPAQPDRHGTAPRGRVDYLTWQSRRIRLHPDDDGRVRGCQLQQNLKLDESTFDPFKCFTRHKELGWVPLRLDLTKAVWRDSHALFQESDDAVRRPEVFNWLAQVEKARRRGQIAARPAYSFAVFGQATDGKAANVALWRQERLPLPLAYLEDPERRARLRAALSLAEDGARALSTSTRLLAELMLAPTADEAYGRKPDGGAVGGLARHFGAGEVYWSRLEAPFKRLLTDLSDGDVGDPTSEDDADERALHDWARTLQSAAWTAFRGATTGQDTSARALKAVARAERELSRQLGRVLGDILTEGRS